MKIERIKKSDLKNGEFPYYRCKTDEEVIFINAKEVMYIKMK